MKSCTWLAVAGLMAWALLPGLAWGNIVNGAFNDNDSVGWDEPVFSSFGDYTEASAKIDDYQMQMYVSTSYVSGSDVQFLYSNAEFSQDVIGAGGFALGGTIALQFDVDVDVDVEIPGTPNVIAFAEARIDVTYVVEDSYSSTGTKDVVESWATTVSTSTNGVNPFTINLPGLIETGSPLLDPNSTLDIRVQTSCWLAPSSNPAPGTTYDISLTATFDNFEFIQGDSGVIPEPLTIFSALLAVGGLGAYIRRRTDSGA